MAGKQFIAVEGCGMVTPFAVGVGREVLKQAGGARFAGGGAYWAIPDEFLNRYDSFNAELKKERGAWITAGALVHACADASIDLKDYPPERVGLVIGSAFAGQLGMIHFAEEVREQSARFVSPIHFPQTVGNYVAGALSRAFAIRGPNLTIASGGLAGLEAIITGVRLLIDGDADVVVAGGSETLSDPIVRGLGTVMDREKNGGVWAEGACLYVLRPIDSANEGRVQCLLEIDVAAGGISGVEDTYSLQPLVGRSLAAESAMRLASAISDDDGSKRREVVHVGDDGQVRRLVAVLPV